MRSFPMMPLERICELLGMFVSFMQMAKIVFFSSRGKECICINEAGRNTCCESL